MDQSPSLVKLSFMEDLIREEHAYFRNNSERSIIPSPPIFLPQEDLEQEFSEEETLTDRSPEGRSSFWSQLSPEDRLSSVAQTTLGLSNGETAFSCNGPIEAYWLRLRPGIEKIVEAEQVNQFETTEPGSFSLLCWMVGKTPTSAAPIVVLWSNTYNPTFLKGVEYELRQSADLLESGFGFSAIIAEDGEPQYYAAIFPGSSAIAFYRFEWEYSLASRPFQGPSDELSLEDIIDDDLTCHSIRDLDCSQRDLNDIFVSLLTQLRDSNLHRVAECTGFIEDVSLLIDELELFSTKIHRAALGKLKGHLYPTVDYRKLLLETKILSLDPVIRRVLMRSRAFESFRGALRYMVVPDVNKAIHNILQHSQQMQSETKTYQLKVELPIRRYCEQELGGDISKLRKFIIVTGTIRKAVAKPCEEYMRWLWPRTSKVMLDVLDWILTWEYSQNLYIRKTIPESGKDCQLFLSVEKGEAKYSSFNVFLCGLNELRQEITQQFAWLVAAFRETSKGSPRYSEIRFKMRGTTSIIEPFPLGLYEPMIEEKDTCWHKLFQNTTIVRGFPIPERSDEVGLELPFELMVHLAGTQYFLPFEGGTILRGFSTILVPISTGPSATTKRRDCLQWHLESSPEKSEHLSTEKLLTFEVPECWYCTSDYELLTQPRAILGYTGHANVHLGTSDSNFARVQDSGCVRERKTLRFTQFGLGASGTAVQSFGMQGSVNFTISKSLNANVPIDKEQNRTKLDNSMRKNVVIYDTGARRGWLVPETSVLLHLLHSWGSKTQPQVTLPFVNPSTNGAAAAADTIYNHSKTIVKNNDDLETFPVHLIDQVKTFMVNLKARREATLMKSQEPGIELSVNQRIKGWDYNEIVELNDIPFRRTVSISRAEASEWLSLVRNNSDILVLFVKDIGQVIRPAPSDRCQDCSSVPSGRGYLTAHLRCLDELRRSGIRISWADMTLSTPFQRCVPGTSSFEDRVQKLRIGKDKDVSANSNSWKEGALVFGKKPRKSRTKCLQQHPNGAHMIGISKTRIESAVIGKYTEDEQLSSAYSKEACIVVSDNYNAPGTT